jgi:hypothetical protein
MKSIKWILTVAICVTFFQATNVIAQQPSKSTGAATQPAAKASSPAKTSVDTNIRAYVELLRSDVNTKKTAIYTQVMNFNDDQAAKFWPIYREYDVELQKLNDQKLAGIQYYANNYETMTDDKANELATLALQLESKRTDLKKTYYEKFRDQLGGIVAARFLQVENQLLMVIDLQIAASLPIVE